MKYSPRIFAHKGKLSLVASIASILLTTQSGFAAAGDKVHAFYADEHNTSATSTTGNRILEIDIENMSLVNTLNVPGNAGHHADNGFNSKIYGVPKGSGFVNVIKLSKDANDTTSMAAPTQIALTHKPRSGDAYNKKFNVILMAAANRPMGSFINVETDTVVGTIGENADCTLTDGSQLLSHSDANTIAAATKYQCTTGSHGGDQVSGHPYWLTSDYAAIVDRTNNRISVYLVTEDASGQLTASLVNHLNTRTSIHQIVPRDRTNLPAAQQADFYAIEEGEHVNGNDYTTGVAHALIHMKLTTNGLQFIRRMDFQRTVTFSKAKSDRILNSCINIYRSTFRQALTGPSTSRENQYNSLFAREGIARSPDQDRYNDFPVDCFYPGIPGGHNADFAPNNKHLYVGMAGGAMSVVDVNRWKIANNIDIGIRTGPGHTCFSEKNNVALSSNHGFSSIFGASMTRSIRYINSERPIGYYYITLPFSRENIINTAQSHTCYVDESGDNYYNFFTDGGVFYKIDLTRVFNNPTNGSDALVVDSLYTGGIPIQGSYIKVKDIKSNVVQSVVANNDTATSNGSSVDIAVLDNDTGDNLIVEYADGASHGTVTVSNSADSVIYTPNAGFTGSDDFWYAISSNGSDWKWANVVVTVNGSSGGTTLVANNDTGTTTSGNSVTVDVIANDTGDSLTLTTVDTAWTGVVTHSGNSITYTAPAGFVGTADIWYEVTDAYGNEEWARLDLTVNSNQGFQANDDAASVKQGQSVTVNVLNNDVGNGLRLTVVDTGWQGVTTSTSDSITYTAPAGTAGDHVGIWYEVTDALGNEDWAQLIIQITN